MGSLLDVLGAEVDGTGRAGMSRNSFQTDRVRVESAEANRGLRIEEGGRDGGTGLQGEKGGVKWERAVGRLWSLLGRFWRKLMGLWQHEGWASLFGELVCLHFS